MILFMALLAMGTLWGYHRLTQQNVETDVAVAGERRFDGLRAALPTRGTVGYLSDTTDRGRYFLTQYFLAPLVIAPDAQRELVVANYSSRATAEGLAAVNNLTVVRDFGNGVALLTRKR